MKLNREQEEAIATREGAWCLLATAGAGKTTVLTERVKALLCENQPINEILALTFTTAAAEEMQTRIGLTLSKSDRGGFRTFHSFGLKLIFAEKEYLKFKLADNPFSSGNGSKILRQVIKERFGRRLSRRDTDELRNYISKAKRSGVKLPDTFDPEILAPTQVTKWHATFVKYNERMRAEGQIDFDDMICLAVELLQDSEIRARHSYRWILVDEGQDTDDIQFYLLQLISQRDGNLFLVADSNQAMYGFRGAKARNVDNFSDWFPGGQTKILPENFRSTPQIVSLAKKLAPVKNSLVENMRTANPDGPEIEVISYLGNDDEADQTLLKIKKLPGKSAILARTNQQIGLIETILTSENIKFNLLGQSGFWRTSEIKNLVSLVKFVLSNQKPETYPQKLVDPVKRIQNSMRASDALSSVIQHANLYELYSDSEYDDKDNFALDNIAGAVKIAQRFNTLREFSEFSTRAMHASRKSKHSIAIGTIHQAKGLQWENVFIIGANEGRIPHEKGDLHEEQCIFYVACTRPEKKLVISYSGIKSRFLKNVEELQQSAV